jgi:hypothetical protein
MWNVFKTFKTTKKRKCVCVCVCVCARARAVALILCAALCLPWRCVYCGWCPGYVCSGRQSVCRLKYSPHGPYNAVERRYSELISEKGGSDNWLKFVYTKKKYYYSVLYYYNSKDQYNFKAGETWQINKCNYELTFSNTSFEISPTLMSVLQTHSLVVAIWLIGSSDNIWIIRVILY